MSGTISTIPASTIVSVVPSVITGGGTGLELIELMLTTNTRIPIGSVLSFPTAASVSSYFGATSNEANSANVYFGGTTISTILPGSLLMAQYPLTAVSAYMRGGPITLTLTQVAALSGSLTIVIDGTTHTDGSLVLTGATSFSNAAAMIQTGLAITGPTQASVTGAIAGTTLTVSAVASGTLAVGQYISGTGITTGTTIAGLLTGTGGTGTYTVSTSQTAASTTITATSPAVSYDSVSGAFVVTSGTTGSASTMAYATGTLAASLNLTSATGAVLSQGAVAAVPATFMAGIVAQTTNWATFQTLFDPDGGSGNTQKQAFAGWVNATNNRYLYMAWDNDITPTQSTAATTSLGYILNSTGSSGTACIYEPTGSNLHLAAFLGGFVASLNFNATNGRQTAAFRSQSGVGASVSNATAAANLIANDYNYYGAYATANENFEFFYPGSVTGKFAWIDSYVNQIWLNNALQLALMEMLTTYGSIPYNPEGYGYIRAAIYDPAVAGVNFGAIRQNVALSSAQISEVNALAGMNIATQLSNIGWYLVIQPATAQTRAARTSPTIIFIYCDGESVQQINLSSVLVQ